MSLKDLRAGIISGDLDAIKRAYESMTGDELPVVEPMNIVVKEPIKKRGRPKKTKFPYGGNTPIIEPQEFDRITATPEYKNQKVPKGFRILEDNLERGSKPRFITNLFEDGGTGKQEKMTPEEQELVDALNSSRIKRPDQSKEVRCKQCGKTEIVRGALAQIKNYKCNSCITGE